MATVSIPSFKPGRVSQSMTTLTFSPWHYSIVTPEVSFIKQYHRSVKTQFECHLQQNATKRYNLNCSSSAIRLRPLTVGIWKSSPGSKRFETLSLNMVLHSVNCTHRQHCFALKQSIPKLRGGTSVCSSLTLLCVEKDGCAR